MGQEEGLGGGSCKEPDWEGTWSQIGAQVLREVIFLVMVSSGVPLEAQGEEQQWRFSVVIFTGGGPFK